MAVSTRGAGSVSWPDAERRTGLRTPGIGPPTPSSAGDVWPDVRAGDPVIPNCGVTRPQSCCRSPEVRIDRRRGLRGDHRPAERHACSCSSHDVPAGSPSSLLQVEIDGHQASSTSPTTSSDRRSRIRGTVIANFLTAAPIDCPRRSTFRPGVRRETAAILDGSIERAPSAIPLLAAAFHLSTGRINSSSPSCRAQRRCPDRPAGRGRARGPGRQPASSVRYERIPCLARLHRNRPDRLDTPSVAGIR